MKTVPLLISIIMQIASGGYLMTKTDHADVACSGNSEVNCIRNQGWLELGGSMTESDWVSLLRFVVIVLLAYSKERLRMQFASGSPFQKYNVLQPMAVP